MGDLGGGDGVGGDGGGEMGGGDVGSAGGNEGRNEDGNEGGNGDGGGATGGGGGSLRWKVCVVTRPTSKNSTLAAVHSAIPASYVTSVSLHSGSRKALHVAVSA